MPIHPTAVIESGAEIGANVTVGPFAFVDAETLIGDDCVIGPNATIFRFTTLDAGCRVHAGAVLGDLPLDAVFDHISRSPLQSRTRQILVALGCGVYQSRMSVPGQGSG